MEYYSNKHPDLIGPIMKSTVNKIIKKPTINNTISDKISQYISQFYNKYIAENKLTIFIIVMIIGFLIYRYNNKNDNKNNKKNLDIDNIDQYLALISNNKPQNNDMTNRYILDNNINQNMSNNISYAEKDMEDNTGYQQIFDNMNYEL